MNTRERTAALAASAVCLFGGAFTHAGTVVHDNSDQTFVMTPGVYSYNSFILNWAIEPGSFWPLLSPDDNAEGMNSGPELMYELAHSAFTSSQVTTERYYAAPGSPRIEWSLEAFSTSTPVTEPHVFQYYPLHPYLGGDAVGPNNFPQPTQNVDSFGPFAFYTWDLHFVPLLGDDVILGFRIHEPEGMHYGFVRFEYQLRTLPTTQNYYNLTGITHLTYWYYTPTMWGYAEELDTPAEIPDLCPGDYDRDRDADPDDITAFVIDYIHPLRLADIDGDGDEDPDDINAFVDAFLSGCSY